MDINYHRHRREIGLDKLLKKLWQNECDGINAITLLFYQKYLEIFYYY